MNLQDPDVRAAFFAVHADLPRQGPGSRSSTRRALGALPGRSAEAVLDIACGPGMQTLHLAELLPEARIHAIDSHPPFVAEARQRLRDAALEARVDVSVADMRALPFPPASFDLLWCEGAVYSMGVEAALTAWAPLLVPGGRIGFSEAVWLKPDPPTELEAWWQADYPQLADPATCRTRVRTAGFDWIDSFVLPESDWWDDYYTPMAARIEQLRSRHGGDPVHRAVLDACALEIDFYRRYSQYYGYLFVLAAPRT